MNDRGCGQVCKVMLAAQAQTQIRLERGEISGLGKHWAHSSHVLCFEGALPTSSVFALFSSLLLCAEGDESYFYVHHHLNDDHLLGFSVLVPSCWVFIQLSHFGGNRFVLLFKNSWLNSNSTPEKRSHHEGVSQTPELCCVSMVTGVYGGNGFWQRCD